MEAKKLADAFL